MFLQPVVVRVTDVPDGRARGLRDRDPRGRNMNLDFGILWIEDSFNPEEEETLKRRVREAGFIARIEVIQNGETIEELARAHPLFERGEALRRGRVRDRSPAAGLRR